jgi:hypothetical protein
MAARAPEQVPVQGGKHRGRIEAVFGLIANRSNQHRNQGRGGALVAAPIGLHV